jgi:uncharacterized YigZ family protein
LQSYKKAVYLQSGMNKEEQIITDSYKSISALSTGIYKDSGSKFLSFALPVKSEEEVKSELTKIKKEYFDATHHCYAYRIGIKGDIWRMNDDGEPSSSAGRPIYGQLLSNELSDTLVVVVRYFGGTKLGIPGLIKAYKTATAEALEQAVIVEKIVKERYELSFEYPDMNNVMRIVKEYNIIPQESRFDIGCSIVTEVRIRDAKQFLKKLKETILNITICQKA